VIGVSVDLAHQRPKMNMGIAEDVLKRFGDSLSRLLRYSFGGFLAVVIAAKVNPVGAAELLHALTWELAAVACVVVGAGIYTAHRSVVIPVHHWIGCFHSGSGTIGSSGTKGSALRPSGR